MVYSFFDKTSAMRTDKFTKGGAIKNRTIWNQQLTEEPHKPIVIKFNKCNIFILSTYGE